MEPLPQSDKEASPQVEPSSKKILRPLFIAVGIIAFLATGLISGIIQYGVAAARCGKLPVAASRFAATYSFELPGERGYGPSPFNLYFCTRAEAESAGFRHNSLTDLGQKEQEAKYRAYEAERAYAQSKVPYRAYTPTYIPSGFEKEVKISIEKYPQGIQVFQEIVRSSDKYDMAAMRQGVLGDDYEVCKGQEACIVIGKTPEGQSIYKDSNSWYSVKFDKSFFNLEPQARFGLMDAEAVKILSSLVPAK